MILVFGRPDDPPISLVVEALQSSGADYSFIDDRYLDRENIVTTVGRGGLDGKLMAAGREIPLQSVGAVYARLLGLRFNDDPAATMRAHAFQEIFMEWLDLTPAMVINRPSAMASNASKPFQAQLIARAGFAVPETIVTNDLDALETFRRRHGRVVFKSTSGVRSIVEELTDQHADRLGRIRALPTQFQSWVPGTDIRVHVVGDEVFATEIVSQATDYRYAARSGPAAALRATELEQEVRERCLALAAALSLPLCGIDLRQRPDGGWVCFEVNPMPAFSYYEGETGAPISDAVARLLIRGPNDPRETNSHGPSR
jgi:glutathione synthase/RimK-type ligase-like ATP-grasp enzyme